MDYPNKGDEVAMEDQPSNSMMNSEIIEVQRILHEICEEPGPAFSFYNVMENCTSHCIDCEIHYEGMFKAPIHINSKQLYRCMQSGQGRLWMKEFLRNEIWGLITEEDWFNNVGLFELSEPHP